MDKVIGMKHRIKIDVDGKELLGVIDDEKSPITANKVKASLPLSGKPIVWGGELYFTVPFHMDDENATEDLEVGDIGYWPPGDVICIFFGRTPASTDERPRPASAVNVVGKVYEPQSLVDIKKPKLVVISSDE